MDTGDLDYYWLASASCFRTSQELKQDNLLTIAPYLRHKHENSIKLLICLRAKEVNKCIQWNVKVLLEGMKWMIEWKMGIFLFFTQMP